MTTRNWVIVGVLAGMVGIAGVTAIGWLVIRQAARQAKNVPDPTPLTEADKRLLVTAADLTRLGFPPVDPAAEKWSSSRQGNGTRFILYVHDPRTEENVYLYSRLVILGSSQGAATYYRMDKAMARLGLPGESTVPAPELLPGGGDRGAWYIEKDGDRIGNFFLVREGPFILSARIIGLTFGKADDVERLLGPALAEARRRAR